MQLAYVIVTIGGVYCRERVQASVKWEMSVEGAQGRVLVYNDECEVWTMGYAAFLSIERYVGVYVGWVRNFMPVAYRRL